MGGADADGPVRDPLASPHHGPRPRLRGRRNDDTRREWYAAYRTTLLDRDLRQLARMEHLSKFGRLMSLALLRGGGLLNRSDLAADAGLDHTSASRYLGLLEVAYQIALLPPYFVAIGKRLVNAPKVPALDSGLGSRHRYGRTSGGAEVDRVVKRPAGTTYYWRVKTKDACGQWGNYSACFSFTTTGESPAPALVSPPDGARPNPGLIQLKWRRVPGAVLYGYRLGPNCGDAATSGELADTVAYYYDPQLDHVIRWQVRSKNACGIWGDYSSCWSFGPTVGVDGQPLITETKITTLKPNPSRGRVEIQYQVAEAAGVRMEVYDVSGRSVRFLNEGTRERGSFTAVWDGKDAHGRETGSGTYFVRMIAGTKWIQKTLLILR